MPCSPGWLLETSSYRYQITKTWLAATRLGNASGLAVSETQALSRQRKQRRHVGCRQVGDGFSHRSASLEGWARKNSAGCMAWGQPGCVSLSSFCMSWYICTTQHSMDLPFQLVVLHDILLANWSTTSNWNIDKNDLPMIIKESSHEHTRK